VHEWMEANQVRQRGIDVRRFVTFGIIKGFLRRVHRWPVHVDTVTGVGRDPSRPRSKDRPRIGDIDEEEPEPSVRTVTSGLGMLRVDGGDMPRKDSMGTTVGTSVSGKNESGITLRTTGSTTGSLGTSPNTGGGIWRARSDSPIQGGFMQVTPMTHRNNNPNNVNQYNAAASKSPGYFQPQPQVPLLSSSLRSNRGTGMISTSHTTNVSAPRGGGGGGSGSQGSFQTGFLGPGGRPVGYHRNSRDARNRGGLKTPGGVTQKEHDTNLHASMLGYLDGLHHTDELQVKFKMGWTKLEDNLRRIAGLPGDLSQFSEEKREAVGRGDFGKVVIVLR
jgi:hypothetical protein